MIRVCKARKYFFTRDTFDNEPVVSKPDVDAGRPVTWADDSPVAPMKEEIGQIASVRNWIQPTMVEQGSARRVHTRTSGLFAILVHLILSAFPCQCARAPSNAWNFQERLCRKKCLVTRNFLFNFKVTDWNKKNENVYSVKKGMPFPRRFRIEIRII